MKKMYLIVWTSLLLLVPLQVFAQPKASNQIPAREAVPASDIFRTKPYLQRPIGDEITICWETNVPVVSWVEYGKDGMLDRKKMLYADGQMICNNMRHHFRLSGLEPGETYSYRVCSQEITLYEPIKRNLGIQQFLMYIRLHCPKKMKRTLLYCCLMICIAISILWIVLRILLRSSKLVMISLFSMEIVLMM